MNHDVYHHDELPELTDEDISLAHQICTLANSSHEPPFKAVFAAYDQVFYEQGIEKEHDDVLFRLLLRVGEAAGKTGRNGWPLDLVGCLKNVLAAQGITLLEDGEVENDDDTRSVVIGQQAQAVDASARKKKNADRRRVSFDDARLEETWLSENTRDLLASPVRKSVSHQNTLAQPARKLRAAGYGQHRRTRSISPQPQNNGLSRHSAAPKHYQSASPSTLGESNADFEANPTLLFQPSQTQLEQNAEAFFSTSAIRSARRCLHAWHDTALGLRQARQQAYAIAAAHDRRTLLKQAWDQWRTHLTARQETLDREALYESRLRELTGRRDNLCLFHALTNWVQSTHDQQAAIEFSKRRILKLRYFHRWRALAVENATKARSVLARKYLAVWRERLVRRQVREEQAIACCEETRIKKCWKAWFWKFCSGRVDEYRGGKMKRRLFGTWILKLRVVRDREAQAQEHYYGRTAQNTLQSIQQHLRSRRQAERIAQTHRDSALCLRTLQTLRIQVELQPIARMLSLRVQLDLQRKAFRTWHLHLSFTREAAEVDRKRVLQSAWTSWNDALRSKALALRIDERVLVDSLYRWVLAERAKLFRRAIDTRLLQRLVQRWRGRLAIVQNSTEGAERRFAESQQRRRMTLAMGKLHMAMRQREDAERAATEFANTHSAVPYVLQTFAERGRHFQELNKWADDARFYTLCTRTLTVWQTQTTKHQTTRRRNAYVHVRARTKLMLVGDCLRRWRARTDAVVALEREADRHAQARVSNVGAKEIFRWRDRTAHVIDLEQRAASLDQQRLLASALGALQQKYVDIVTLDEQAAAFRYESDMALTASAVKKLQWAQFTAARRNESAEALWARNRDTHIRLMIRLWYTKALARRAEKERPALTAADEEPDSPSLRPASRAASRSAQRPAMSSPPTATATPAYMRTPSRTRRAGRFRPLPTPAAITPFAFDSAYLATTPAPFPAPDLRAEEDTGEMSTLTPQITPFARKLRAGGIVGTGGLSTPVPPTSILGRSVRGGTAKSVRFAGASRFGHVKSS